MRNSEELSVGSVESGLKSGKGKRKKKPDGICIKLMPNEGLVPKWLLKRFWKAEIISDC